MMVTMTMTMMMMMMTMMMQVQYSERESERGGSGVSLGSRERLAPPSSSSESLGELSVVWWGISAARQFHKDVPKCKNCTSQRCNTHSVVISPDIKFCY